ncbi:MAG: DNA-methyltransferase [Candidatus Heimdallarchaeaceae archaeon]
MDCFEGLKKLEDESIDLIVTSPPYNKGFWDRNKNVNNGFKTKVKNIIYDKFNDNLQPKDYEKQQIYIIRECLRVLKKSGSLFYNHSDRLHKHQTIHPLWVYQFPLKQILIWDRGNTPKLDKSYFFPITEYIFWIQKTPTSRTYFNRKNVIMNKNIWKMKPDTKNDFPAPFPIELPLNCILSCCPEKGIVLDPYMGSGTTAIACIKSDRYYIGFELSKKYCDMANKRIYKFKRELKKS